MTDKLRARLGLGVVVLATILTMLSVAIPAVNTTYYTIVQIALWIVAAAVVLPFYTKRRVASMDEYLCPQKSVADVKETLRGELGENAVIKGDLVYAQNGERIDAVMLFEAERCTQEMTKAMDAAFAARLKEAVPDSDKRSITAAYLLFVGEENKALNDYLKLGGAEAHVTAEATRIRIASAFVAPKGMLYVARPSDGEHALFEKEDVRMSSLLARALRK